MPEQTQGLDWVSSSIQDDSWTYMIRKILRPWAGIDDLILWSLRSRAFLEQDLLSSGLTQGRADTAETF